MAVNVTEGEVRWFDEDSASLILRSRLADDIYQDYVVENRYFKEGSIYVLPCASPAGFRGISTAFVQLTAPTLLWVAEWTAARWNNPPQIPSPLLLGRNVLRTIGASSRIGPATWVLLDESITARNILLAADGVTPIYRLSGVYVYGCLNPSDVLVRDVRIPKPAWSREPEHGRDVPEGLLTQFIIN